MGLPPKKALKECVDFLIQKNHEVCEKFEIEDNVTDTLSDPFVFLLQCGANKISLEDWLKLEKNRRIDKALTNFIGEFHERVINALPSWKKPKRGFDARNDDLKIIAEIKNKYRHC